MADESEQKAASAMVKTKKFVQSTENSAPNSKLMVFLWDHEKHAKKKNYHKKERKRRKISVFIAADCSHCGLFHIGSCRQRWALIFQHVLIFFFFSFCHKCHDIQWICCFLFVGQALFNLVQCFNAFPCKHIRSDYNWSNVIAY